MTIQELFIRANEELLKVVDQIGDHQWQLELPINMSNKPQNVKTAVNYHAYDDAWVPEVLAGKTKDEVGDRFDSVLTASDTKTVYGQYNGEAIEAVRNFTDLEKNTHLSYGDFPARDYLQHITSFRGFRIYDISKLIGIDTTMAPDLVDAMIAEFTPQMEFYRSVGVFPEPLDVPDDASPQTKLLAMAGRE